MERKIMKSYSQNESRVSKSGRAIKTPKTLLTTSSDEAPRRKRSSKKALTVQNELQRLRAIAKNICAKPQTVVGEEEVAATVVVSKSLSDLPQSNISSCTNIDQSNLKQTNTATDESLKPGCSKILTPCTSTTRRTVSPILPCAEPSSEHNMDEGGENRNDEVLEERLNVNSDAVITSLREILQQNKEIQRQNREILLENKDLKKQILTLLDQHTRCVGEVCQRTLGEEIAVPLYEPLEGFPLETVEQFREMDSVSKKSIRQKLYVHLCNLGGTRVREFLNSALKQVMTDKLVHSFTWPGCKKSAQFGDTKIANVLFMAAKKCPLFRGPETKAEYKTEMLEVFRSTKQRYRNSLKKSLETEEQDIENPEDVLEKIKRLEQTLNETNKGNDLDDEDFESDDDI